VLKKINGKINGKVSSAFQVLEEEILLGSEFTARLNVEYISINIYNLI